MVSEGSWLAPRWRGQACRLEVWYLTWTDRTTGTGGWVHVETVAPTGQHGPGSAPFAHGWVALFPADAPPRLERFGPAPAAAPGSGTDGSWWSLGPSGAKGWARVEAGERPGSVRMSGVAAGMTWDVLVEGSDEPVWTFPKVVWERELLPGAQMVPMPSANVRGAVVVDGRAHAVDGPGALARIYGHGSAQRWGWLHATLDDDGSVLEIVTATARRRGLRALPPLALVQLRRPGHDDWPRNPLVAAPRLRTKLGPTGFTVEGRADGHRFRAEVVLPADRTVALQYVDPDGATASCTNSEVATAEVALTGRSGEAAWSLDGTAHAEVGHRP